MRDIVGVPPQKQDSEAHLVFTSHCRCEANVELADTERIMPYSVAIPAHEVRERCIRAMDGEYAPVASV